ncbi:MAG: FHA domain-containing protein [Gammaproteobacteria bacterium]|nr:FHA domain-containing protein [Gammaproteobacteria bacterium]MDH5617513.1 FHA domain-containing protein [Gammaproteobacteria bacterium]
MERDRQSAFIQYPSQQEAFGFLEGVLADPKGLGLLHGPDVAGKSELIEQIAQKVRERADVAVVDGSQLRPAAFLNAVLAEYGYELELGSVDELLNMINVFGMQQAKTREAPVLILEHLNRMLPSTLAVLCKLAQLTSEQRFIVRIILVGDRYFRRVIDSPRMLPIAIRLVGSFEMKPLTKRESLVYLSARLKANGVENPASVIPAEISDSLHVVSEGWPGNLDRIADSIVAREHDFPLRLEDLGVVRTDSLFSTYDKVSEDDRDVPLLDDVVEPESPHLIISHNGQVVQEVTLDSARTLLGRSALSDVVIENQYVSKQHAMLVRSDGGLVLLDLKSRNGTYVNSRRVQSQVLRSNDVISIGDFRIKVVLPPSYGAAMFGGIEMTDTTKMMTIEDARRARKDEQHRLTEVKGKYNEQQ